MPIYEYKCTVCDSLLEVEQKITDNTLKTLAGCDVAKNGRHRLKKVFSAVGISFKGEGFYRNDSRGKKSSSRSPSSDSTESTTSSESSSTSSTSNGNGNGDSSSAGSGAGSTTKSNGSGSSGSSDRSTSSASASGN